MPEAAGGGRFAACHHWRALAAAGSSAPPPVLALAPGAKARLALYRQAVARREAAARPVPTEET